MGVNEPAARGRMVQRGVFQIMARAVTFNWFFAKLGGIFIGFRRFRNF